MEKITQKLLGLVVPKEWLDIYELETIVEEKEYVELVLRETRQLPDKITGEMVELLRYSEIQLLTFPIKGKQCRITLLQKRWKLKGSGRTVMNELPVKMYGIKIPKEFGDYLKRIIEYQVTDIPRIARIMRICPKTLEKWYQKNLTDMEAVAENNVIVTKNIGTRLKIDEVCLHKGDFWTILSNADTKKACAIMEGTSVEKLKQHFDKFSIKDRFGVKEITMDMSESFDWIAREYFPDAVKVIDRFHVQSEVYDGVQKIRTTERTAVLKKEKDGTKDTKTFSNGDNRKQLLARSRGLLFKSSTSWTDSQSERAKILFEEYPEIKEGYLLSQKLKNWYDQLHSRQQAEVELQKWYQEVNSTGIKSMIESAETIKRHEGKILNYFLNRSTNAFAESLNSKVKLFKTLVRGINNPRFFIYRLSTYIT